MDCWCLQGNHPILGNERLNAGIFLGDLGMLPGGGSRPAFGMGWKANQGANHGGSGDARHQLPASACHCGLLPGSIRTCTHVRKQM